MSDPMTEGAKTGTPIQRWMLDRSSEGPDEMVKDRRGRYVLLEDHVADLTEALKVAGEGLDRAVRFIEPMTDRDYELPSAYHLDGYLVVQGIYDELKSTLAALDRIRTKGT